MSADPNTPTADPRGPAVGVVGTDGKVWIDRPVATLDAVLDAVRVLSAAITRLDDEARAMRAEVREQVASTRAEVRALGVATVRASRPTAAEDDIVRPFAPPPQFTGEPMAPLPVEKPSRRRIVEYVKADATESEVFRVRVALDDGTPKTIGEIREATKLPDDTIKAALKHLGAVKSGQARGTRYALPSVQP